MQQSGREFLHGSGETLDSWKEIATYLRRDVRTAMRWERSRRLPVRRYPGGGKAGVYALRSELDGWLKSMRLHVVAAEAASCPPKDDGPSVAVLPFLNLSAERETEYFGDGLADGIIMDLSRVPGLRVTARTSSFAYRDGRRDVRVIGARLGVNTVLEGAVQRCGARVRITVQLIDATDGFHLWGGRFDRELSDVFALQDEISQAVAHALEVKLAARPKQDRSVNQLAYTHWLKARHYEHHDDIDAIPKCLDSLHRAIAADPEFPLPYLGLAEVLRHAACYHVVGPEEALERGWAAIRKSFALQESGEAYALSGAYRAWRDFDWARSREDFERALELAPGSEQVHRLYASYFLVPTGRMRRAEEEMRRAVASDPLSPMAHIELGKTLLWEHQWDAAEAEMETAFDLRPNYPLAIWYRGIALFYQGRIEEALAFWPEATRTYAFGVTGMCLAKLGRQAEARALLARADEQEGKRAGIAMYRALIYLGLDDRERAFEWLNRMVDIRDPHVLDFPCKPIYDHLRTDPRFAPLLRRMGLR